MYQYDENIYIVQHHGYHLDGVGEDGWSDYSLGSIIYGDIVNLSDETLYYIIVKGNVYHEGKLWENTGYRQDLAFRHNYNIADGKPTELAISPFKVSLHPGESTPFLLQPGQNGFDCYEIWIESYKREDIEVGISDEVMRSDFTITNAELTDRGLLKGTVHNTSPNKIQNGFVIITEYNQDDEIFAIKGTTLGQMGADKKKKFDFHVFMPGMPANSLFEKFWFEKPHNYEITAWGYTDDASGLKASLGFAGDIIHKAESLYYPDKKLAYYMDIDELRKQAVIDNQKIPNQNFCLSKEQSPMIIQESSSKQNIPEWVKNTAGWWADGEIPDSAFVNGIQYLIKEGIITIPETEQGNSDSSEIPEWVKNTAGWWADGEIPDSAFVNGIQYLIKEGIIKI